MNRRSSDRQDIVIRPDGSVWDRAAFRRFMASWDARAPRIETVRRLSTEDAAIAAFEATARGSRADAA